MNCGWDLKPSIDQHLLQELPAPVPLIVCHSVRCNLPCPLQQGVPGPSLGFPQGTLQGDTCGCGAAGAAGPGGRRVGHCCVNCRRLRTQVNAM